MHHPRPPLPPASYNNQRYNQREVRDSLQNANLWKAYLYELQIQAPTPKRVVCQHEVPNNVRPPHYGREFHGIISRDEADRVLSGEDGRYLVRESQRSPGQCTLSLRFNGVTKNFRLYYDGQHFVGEKRFDTIHDLVADGLITLYLEQNAGEYIASLGNQCKYEESPYMTLHKKHRANRSRGNPKRHSSAISRQSSKMAPEAHRISNYDPSLSIPEETESPVDVQLFEKSHTFKVHNFMGLPWCEFCGNFMWGILGQGVKCEDCGFSAHRKCSEKVPADCCPDLRHIRRVFGVDLTTLVKACNTIRPFVVDLCVKEIENRGLHVEGLYRVSGFADDVEALKTKLESESESADNYLRSCDDVHVITGVLKMFFRHLPVPVITFDTYPFFLQAIRRKNDDDKLHGLRDAINKLPPAHYQTLKYFLGHLNRVSQLSEQNLMTAYNLSTVFCPTLMRTPGIGLMPFQINCWQEEGSVLEYLINYQSRLFK
ncbi:N-chimaerin [Halotydeus destructor]|nr:N-chimaerin [Halotydeus destructor]